MSGKKYQPVNSYREGLSCKKVVDQIVSLVKKIKTGEFTSEEIKTCEKLTKKLENLLEKSNSLDKIDRWLAKETIEMSQYTCNRYAQSPASDKIEL